MTEGSDKPLEVDGVTVIPLDQHERVARYVEWYAAKHGLTVEEALARIDEGGF